MIILRTTVLTLVLLLSSIAVGEEGGTPRTFLFDLADFDRAVEQYKAGDMRYKGAVDYLMKYARSAVTSRLSWSVMDKDVIPPSGDKHDFFTFGVYQWPNPDTPDGLPWITLDGHPNSYAAMDSREYFRVAKYSYSAALAYRMTGDERYAEAAANLLRVWHLDPETRMNPEIRFTNWTPGWDNEEATAQNTNKIRMIVDAAGLIEDSAAWTAEDKAGLVDWYTRNYQWNMSHPSEDYARVTKDNHRARYLSAIAESAAYAGNDEVAIAMINDFKNVIAYTFNEDGSQIYEMKRANNYMYHEYHVRIILDLLDLDRVMGYDTGLKDVVVDNKSIRQAVEFLIPYATGELEWTFWHDEEFANTNVWHRSLFLRAAKIWDDPMFLEAAYNVKGNPYDLGTMLTHAPVPEPGALTLLAVGGLLSLVLRRRRRECFVPA